MNGTGTADVATPINAPPKFATLESLQTLVEETTVIDTSAGAFEIKKISVFEFLEMQKEAETDDGATDEWVATKLLMAAAVIKPPIGEDENLLASLPVGLLKELVAGISEFAGVGEDFTGGSRTG